MADAKAPVLILGAGINGAALARELALQNIPVCVVDRADIAYGATSYSSRLIHGGLRYLEYGEFDLVRESLHERGLLLRLAPKLVHPLRLFIPVERRAGGLIRSAARFLHLDRLTKGPPHRGLWLVTMGLRFYDFLARDPQLPKHSVVRSSNSIAPPVDRRRFPWLASYYDAQIRFPERFVVSLFRDAATQPGFELFTYTTATLDGKTVTLRSAAGETIRTFEPSAIINASGAWVDRTLQTLHVQSPKLMGGTKGSHLVCTNAKLRSALEHGGLYAEAADGRPVFVLPWGPLTLVGTTDLPFSADPATAVADVGEIDYLLSTVNTLMPDVRLTPDDVLLHYSGVRPLPASDPSQPGAITRRHWMQEHTDAPLPMYSIIGGKLTTCRSLAESAADTILGRLNLHRIVSTRDRPIDDALDTSTFELPGDVVRRVIRDEWVKQLDDLVERRLMSLYDPSLSRSRLRELAELMVAEGKLSAAEVPAAVERVVERLRRHFGRNI
jgi:glycerol-3-phosphate dehydrogenase